MSKEMFGCKKYTANRMEGVAKDTPSVGRAMRELKSIESGTEQGCLNFGQEGEYRRQRCKPYVFR